MAESCVKIVLMAKSLIAGSQRGPKYDIGLCPNRRPCWKSAEGCSGDINPVVQILDVELSKISLLQCFAKLNQKVYLWRNPGCDDVAKFLDPLSKIFRRPSLSNSSLFVSLLNFRNGKKRNKGYSQTVVASEISPANCIASLNCTRTRGAFGS